MKKESFGTIERSERPSDTVHRYTLENAFLKVRLLSFGARVQELWAPSRKGVLENVVLGYSALQDYQNDTFYVGPVVGRFANRIANASFVIAGKRHRLTPNEATGGGNGRGANHLHGGRHGLSQQNWQEHSADETSVTFFLSSPDGQEGYPGEVHFFARYSLMGNSVNLELRATTNALTPINLTQHMYFNLLGAGALTTIDGHLLKVFAKQSLECDLRLIPTGRFLPLRSFQTPEPLKDRVLDFCGVLRRLGSELVQAAELTEPTSGRRLTVKTTQPGIQIYTADFYDPWPRGGICLETQHFPDSPNQSHFPNTLLSPGQVYQHFVSYSFDCLAEC